jgi:uncharacterized protein (TIGR00299 family) protein
MQFSAEGYGRHERDLDRADLAASRPARACRLRRSGYRNREGRTLMSRSAPVLFVDASAGASGDMILGALVDLGVPLARIRRALEGLPVGGWTLRGRRVVRCAVAGRKVDVRVKGHQPHRGWAALQKVVAGGKLEPEVRERSLAIFRRLIEAEARAHGLPADKVHLHEAGGTDAIIDVVGACVGLSHLAPGRIVVSPMTTGFGTVRCAHGDYPVPGPATLELVHGCPVRAGNIEAERLTPTGAAILTQIADEWGRLPAMLPKAVGYGAGDRDLGDAPNLLRMVLGEADAATARPSGQVVVLECTLDDSTPQALAFAAERLLEAGALDVVTGPVTMKKSRPGHHLTVLARPEQWEELARRIFEETSTIGLRFRAESRLELERSARTVETEFGPLSVKLAFLGDRVVQAWPEYDQCAAAARRHAVSLTRVQQEALRKLKTARRGARGKRRT